MTDQISFLPMLDDAEHPTWLLSGKPVLLPQAEGSTGDALQIARQLAAHLTEA